MAKKYLNKDVLTAARERIAFVFDEFEHVYVSFSGGKDSTVMLHLAIDEARKRGRLPLDVLVVDLEGQYQCTIDHIEEMLDMPEVNGYWVCLPLNLRNAVSVFQPHWCCWEPGKEDIWIRPLPKHPAVINDPAHFPFFKYRMEFEEFVPQFGEWAARGKRTACLVGIRADESLNRYRTIVKDRASRYKDRGWTTQVTENVWNAYPIYDWRTEDIWTFIGKESLPYNRLYDMMYLGGKSIHEMRICQPYGDDQRKGLDQFHHIEPETWFRTVQRVSGANFGNLYCGQKVLGYNRGLGLPKGHTWESYTYLLLDTLPDASREHYRRKFAVFIHWWKTHGQWEGDIPNEADPKLEAAKQAPSWRRMALCILRNDFWCKSLSFTMTKDIYAEFYQKLENGENPYIKPSVKERYANL
jgi:predicted phosphoadenosine phosphosulfate sulfurtransferase